MDMGHNCAECRQPVRLFFTAYATEFGQIACRDDYESFMKDGLCSLCGNWLAEFAIMDTRGVDKP